MTRLDVKTVNILITSSYLIFVSLVRACNRTFFSECVGGLALDLHDRSASESLFPVYDNETLQHICGFMLSDDVDYCATLARADCYNDAEQREFNNSIQVVRFLCTDGLPGYVSHRNCYTKADVISSSFNCEKTFQKELTDVKTAQFICRTMDKLIDCVRGTVNDYCGQEPADWIIRVKKITLQPTRDIVGCRNYAPPQTDPGVFVILFFAILLTVMAAAIPAVVCGCRLRKKRHLQSGIATNVAKNRPEKGNQTRLVAAEAILTSSSDLQCCGPVHSAVRDTNEKTRPPLVAESICLNELMK